MRSRRAALPVAAILLGCALPPGCSGPAGENLTSALGQTPPRSARVLELADGSTLLTSKAWVHFKISPADADRLIASRPFVQAEKPAFDFSSLGPPAWWTPKTLGKGAVEYRWDEHRPGEDEIDGTHIIQFNSRKDEAYAVYFSVY